MPYSVGDVVEPFALPRADGGEHAIEPSAHTATIVIWTCNHCPYALAWHERIQAVIRDYAPRGVDAVQINANDSAKYPDDSIGAMAARIDAGDFASDYARDDNQQLSKRWGAKVTPDVFILDAEGRVVYRGAPDSDHDDPSQNGAYLRDALDDVLAGREIRQPETQVRGCSVKWIINDQPNPYV